MSTYSGYSIYQQGQLTQIDTNLSSLETLINNNASGVTGYIASKDVEVEEIRAGLTGIANSYNDYVTSNTSAVATLGAGVTGYVATSTERADDIQADVTSHQSDFLTCKSDVETQLEAIGVTGAALHDDFLEYKDQTNETLSAVGVGLANRVTTLEIGVTGIQGQIDDIIDNQLPAKLTENPDWNDFIAEMNSADGIITAGILTKTATIVKQNLDAEQDAKIQALIDFVNLTLKTYRIVDQNNVEYVFPLAPTAISLSYDATTYTVSYTDVPTNLRGQTVTIVSVGNTTINVGTVTLSSTGSGSFTISSLTTRPLLNGTLKIKNGDADVDIAPTAGLQITDLPWANHSTLVTLSVNENGDLVLAVKPPAFNTVPLSGYNCKLLNQNNVAYGGMGDVFSFDNVTEGGVIFTQAQLASMGVVAGSQYKVGFEEEKLIFSSTYTYTFVPPYLEPTLWDKVGNATSTNTTSAAVNALVFDVGTNSLYYGGSLTTVAGSGATATTSNFARFDVSTSTWIRYSTAASIFGFTDLKVLPNGKIAIAYFSNVYVFTETGTTTANGQRVLSYVALGGGFQNGNANKLEVDSNGNLVIVGGFTTCRNTVGGSDILCGGVCRWNFTTETFETFGNGLFTSTGNSVTAITLLSNGNIVVGGESGFSYNGNTSNIAMWNGTQWTPLGHANSNILVLKTLVNGNVVMGGRFTAITVGSNTNLFTRVAVFDFSSNVWTGLKGGANERVEDINVLSNGDLIISGQFSTVYNGVSSTSPVTAGRIARWNSTSQTWTPVGRGLVSAGNERITRVATSVINNKLTIYAGGSGFDKAYDTGSGYVPVPNLARFTTYLDKQMYMIRSAYDTNYIGFNNIDAAAIAAGYPANASSDLIAYLWKKIDGGYFTLTTTVYNVSFQLGYGAGYSQSNDMIYNAAADPAATQYYFGDETGEIRYSNVLTRW